MIDKVKAFLGGLFGRICYLGLAVLSGRIGWFFLKVMNGIIDKYDATTPEGHLDFYKAGIHLFPIMGSCVMGIFLFFLAFVCIGVACTRNKHKDKQTEDTEELK